MKEIIERLQTFDKAHGWDNYANLETELEKIEALERNIVHLLGEFGEFANEVKKARRDGTFHIDTFREEWVDMFTFMLKLSFVLDMDIEMEWNKKMDYNDQRFKHHLKENA